MTPFWLTGYGKRFLEGQLPQLLKALTSIATEMKRANDLQVLRLRLPEMTEQLKSAQGSMSAAYAAIDRDDSKDALIRAADKLKVIETTLKEVQDGRRPSVL